jgi:hypothetical protein
VNGDIKLSFRYDDIQQLADSLPYYIASIDHRYGIVNYDNSELLPFEYDWIEAFDDFIVLKKNGMYGFANMSPQIIAECKCLKFAAPNLGHIALCKANTEASDYIEHDGKYGMVEMSSGDIVIPFEYEFLGDYSEDKLICAKKNGKYGYINLKNKTIIPFKYDSAKAFSEGLACVGEIKGSYLSILGERIPIIKFNFIDTSGQIVINSSFGFRYLSIS